MSVKSLFVYTLSITLGIGAVTHAKSQLIEQGLEEAAQTEELALSHWRSEDELALSNETPVQLCAQPLAPLDCVTGIHHRD